MTQPAVPPTIRLATPDDAMAITILYQRIYNGHYTNLLMRDTEVLARFLANSTTVWVIAEDSEHRTSEGKSSFRLSPSTRIVGSVVYEADVTHRLARAFGGAVLPEYRGAGILEKSMKFAQHHLMNAIKSVDVVYATTRTSTPAPQIVTEHLGFKKLGIFPNVHRTDVYETHCLAALFTQESLWNRFTDFRLHPRLKNLFEVVRTECTLPALLPATEDDLSLDNFEQKIDLELIAAEKYAQYRHELQREEGSLQAHFYPFHTANMVISSPCQTVEIFLFVAASDKHCTIMGVKKPREYDFTDILEQCVKLLNASGVRYIEILVRADKVKTMERVLKARFIPCAYFPAFQLNGTARYDFAVLSRTFEVLDFTYLKLAGKNRVFLDEYIRNIEEFFLRPKSVIEDKNAPH